MPPPASPPLTGMAQAITRLDAAMGPEYSSRAMGRALGASEASIRRWRSNWPVAETAVLALSKALGLDPAQVRGYAPLPEGWPPPPLLARLARERRAPGRKPNQPAEPAPAAPAEPAHQIAELRALILRLGAVVMERLERIERAIALDGADGETVKNGASYATGTATPPIEPDA